jgi:hypothetical protein
MLAKAHMNVFSRASSDLSFGKSARSSTFDQKEMEAGPTGDYPREGVCKAEPTSRQSGPRREAGGMDADEHPEMTGWLRKRNRKAKGTLVRAHFPMARADLAGGSSQRATSGRATGLSQPFPYTCNAVSVSHRRSAGSASW